jgi:hypothetical protein
MLYQLPMEKVHRRQNQNLLQISWLHVTERNTSWKIFGGGMERCSNFFAIRALF